MGYGSIFSLSLILTNLLYIFINVSSLTVNPHVANMSLVPRSQSNKTLRSKNVPSVTYVVYIA